MEKEKVIIKKTKGIIMISLEGASDSGWL